MLRIAPNGQLPMAGGAPPAAPPDPTGLDPQDQDPNAQIDPDGDGDDDSKVHQAVAGYMGSDMGPFECQRCEHFDGQSSCNIVEGTIDPAGCCNLFEPQAMDQSDGTPDQGAPDVAEQQLQ